MAESGDLINASAEADEQGITVAPLRKTIVYALQHELLLALALGAAVVAALWYFLGA